MPYRLTVKPPVLYASWNGFSSGDLREIAERLAEMRRAAAHPVAYLARIPDGPHVFTEGEQAVLLAFLQTILPSCATLHHVIEGDGFVKSARIAIVTTLARSTARTRDFYTHSTLGEGFASVRGLYGVDFAEMLPGSVHPPPERASGAFREAARIAEGRRAPPRRGS
jgi:hypothetical protein